jgi:hypothetical protein
MADHTDILLDDTFDLIIENGDFKLGDAWVQDIELILTLSKGELKSDPLLGPYLIQAINAKERNVRIEQRVKVNLERDGKQVSNIKIDNGNIIIIP